MNYCSLDDAFGSDYGHPLVYPEHPTQIPQQMEPAQAPVHYTCYDFREHLLHCSHCSKILAETRNEFYKQDDTTSNMIILFLILLLIWAMSSKN